MSVMVHESSTWASFTFPLTSLTCADPPTSPASTLPLMSLILRFTSRGTRSVMRWRTS